MTDQNQIARRSLRMTSKPALTALIATIAFAGMSDAALVRVSDGSFVQGNSTVDGSYTQNITINPGSTADMLIVGTSTELGTAAGQPAGSLTATFAGVDMILASGNGTQGNLFYIDLSTTSYVTGNATLSITSTYTAGGDLGVGWASIREDTGLGAGESIELHAVSSDRTGTSIDLVTTEDDAFVFTNFNGNKANGTGNNLSGGLTEIYANGSFGSNGGAAGYEEDVDAGTSTYTWDTGSPRRFDAAAFVVVVPEPGSLALLAAGGLLMINRRRRA